MSGTSPQRRPVILKVLPGGEMGITAVIFAGDVPQHPHLRRAERAIRDCHPQHIGVQLQIEAILQPQRTELIFAQLAG